MQTHPDRHLDWTSIDAEVRELLDGVPLDRDLIEQFMAQIMTGELGPDSARLREEVLPAASGDVDLLSGLSAERRLQLEALGEAALQRGEVATAVLNGGMATRFGGAVKGTVEAVGGRCFLEIKRDQAHRRSPAPLLVMNSFATHRSTLRFLREHQLEAGVRCFVQSVSLRLTPEGGLFRDCDGRLSPYAPGHGDFPSALRDSGLLDELESAGVRALLLSNVDNLGAELDPLVVGYHLAHGRPLTCEVAEARTGDVGGAPARVAGRLQVVEGFRFPLGFPMEQNRFLNTNTFVISLSVLRRDLALSWCYVEKTVDGRAAVQIERLVNELSTHVETAYLATPRDGPDGRFFPVKTPADLEALRGDPLLAERFARV